MFGVLISWNRIPIPTQFRADVNSTLSFRLHQRAPPIANREYPHHYISFPVMLGINTPHDALHQCSRRTSESWQTQRVFFNCILQIGVPQL